jgi:hypothetical protein
MKRTTDDYRRALCAGLTQRIVASSAAARPISGSWSWNAMIANAPRSYAAAVRHSWSQGASAG